MPVCQVRLAGQFQRLRDNRMDLDGELIQRHFFLSIRMYATTPWSVGRYVGMSVGSLITFLNF